MIKKTICLSSKSFISLKLNQLVISITEDGKEKVVTRPIEDLGILILESPAITMTSALISKLVEYNVAVITCDDKHMPAGLLLPLAYNSKLSEKTSYQINSSMPLRKQLWQQTVSAKIANQAALLSQYCKENTNCMRVWSKSVKSGDSDNLEARAAIFYWHNIFPEHVKFGRGDEDHPINSLLNYGYAILRAIVARALVASGLIPTIGIFHSNKYNAYCLADDIMEPYRPYVDKVVLDIIDKYGHECSIDNNIKRELLSVATMDVTIERLKRPLMNAVTITTASLVKCFTGEARKISYPVVK